MNEAIGNSQPRQTRILIADDSVAIRTSLSALISRLPGIEIAGVAVTGTEAVQMARSLRPDLMTLDLRMPEMSGIQVLEALRRERLAPVIIMLTGMSEPQYQRKCIELGAKYFLHKTTEFEKVIDILQEHNPSLNESKSPEN